MSSEPDIAAGQLVLKGVLESCSFTGFVDFVRALPDLLGVEIPASVSNVVLSAEQPSEGERGKIWMRQDSDGKFVGGYIFSEGTWSQFFPAPNGIFWMYGDSRNVPPGYTLADEQNTKLPQGVGLFLKNRWKFDDTATFYTAFEVTFNGL